MKYIFSNPNVSGAYSAPMSNYFKGAVALTDEQADLLIEYNGFVTITTIEDTVEVTPNIEAWEAWKAEQPVPDATSKRENAYNTQAIIEWDGEMLTITQAAQLWQYYAAEGSDKANELTTLIATAKQSIREQYPNVDSESTLENIEPPEHSD